MSNNYSGENEKAKKVEAFENDLKNALDGICKVNSEHHGQILMLNAQISSSIPKIFEKYIKTGFKGLRLFSKSTPLLKQAKSTIEKNPINKAFLKDTETPIAEIINNTKSKSELDKTMKMLKKEIEKVEKMLKSLGKLKDFDEKSSRKGHDPLLSPIIPGGTATKTWIYINNMYNVISLNIKDAKKILERDYNFQLDSLKIGERLAKKPEPYSKLEKTKRKTL